MQARKRPLVPWITLALTTVGAMLGVATPSHASVSVALSLDDVARASTLVARVTPIDRVSTWQDGRIVTITRVHVDQTIAGSTGLSELRVRTLGGVVDNIGQRVEGEAAFEPGRPSLVFVAPTSNGTAFSVTGRAQGQLAIVREKASGREIARVRGTGALLAPLTRAPLATPGPLVTSLDGVAADEAAKAAASAWEHTHAR